MQFGGSILADIIWYLIARGLPGVAQVAVVFIVTKLTGASGYAVFGFCLAMATSVSAAAAGWLNQGCYRYLPLKSHRRAELLEAVRSSARWTLVAAGVMSFSVSGLSSPGETSRLLLYSGMVLAISMSGYSALLGVLQAQGLAKRFALIESGRAGVAILLLLALFATQSASVVLAVSFYSFAYIAFSVILWQSVFGPRNLLNSARALHRRQLFVRRLLRFGIPMSAWVFTYTLLPFSDRYLIQLSVDGASAGRYMAAYDLVVRSAALLLMPLTIAVHPRVMRALSERRTADATLLLVRGLCLQVLVCVTLCAVIALWGSSILAAVADGSELTSSLLLLLAVGGCLWQVALFAHKVLEATGQTAWILGSMILAMLSSVGWNLMMLPAMGVIAAAYALCISALVYISLTSAKSYLTLRTISSHPDDPRKRLVRR